MTKMNIGVITFPLGNSGKHALSNLIDILCPISSLIYLITGNVALSYFKYDKRIISYGMNYTSKKNIFVKAINFIYLQLIFSLYLIWIGRKADIWIFFIGCESFLLPMMVVKLLHIKSILLLAGYPSKNIKSQRNIVWNLTRLLSRINLSLSREIIVYSPNVINERKLERYENKIHIAHKHFLDFGEFKITRTIESRETKVGYIGSLSQVKGVINFLQAVFIILQNDSRLKISIVGDGELYNMIISEISASGYHENIQLYKWVPHNEVAKYLNELKLIVIPSYSEGLPNIMLEAMACGVPVLAAPVGSIKDIIVDGVNGFIMEDNSPDCIAKNIMRALNYPCLDKIVINAHDLVINNFSFEKAIERYKLILDPPKE